MNYSHTCGVCIISTSKNTPLWSSFTKFWKAYCNIWVCFFKFYMGFFDVTQHCFCLHPLFTERVSITALLLICSTNSMSEKLQSIFRNQWRKLNDTWQDDRCGGVRSSDRIARTLCALTTLLLICQHCCWCLFSTFGAVTYHPSKFHFLLWTRTWIRIFLTSCKTRFMCLHIIFRGRVISE
jgi:hypothetical protein